MSEPFFHQLEAIKEFFATDVMSGRTQQPKHVQLCGSQLHVGGEHPCMLDLHTSMSLGSPGTLL